MKYLSRTIAVLALLATTIAVPGAASAETIIRAIFKITLTDSASGTVLNTSRLSVRSWPTMDQCKTQSAKGSFHVRSVEGFGIKNSSGEPLAVQRASVNCIVVSE